MTGRAKDVPWREAGFTYIETLVALLIASTLMGGTALFLRAVWTESLESAGRAADLRRVIEAERSLRTAAGRISPPWWLEGPDIAGSMSGYRVGCLDGIAARTLTLGLVNDGVPVLEIRLGEESATRLTLPEGARLAVDAAGARLTVELKEEPILIVAPWSGRSLEP